MKEIIISLKQITNGGTTCTSPVITWEAPYCGDIVCVKNDGKEITLQIPDDCAGECLYAIIDCSSTCSTCEPQKIKVCPCDSNLDCEDCSTCINGLCVSKCPDKVCVNGECADCDNTKPCPCNQKCVNGNCQCPPDKPFKNEKGCCVNCQKDSDCPPCHICTENGCIPIDCPDSVCDPKTNKCVECLNSGDCDGENECCKNNKCDCCDGFVRNPQTGKCDPLPDCTTDTQCPECYTCKDGKCVPVICPEGYICVNGTCQKECDCNNPTNCPAGKSCIPTGNGKCYCSSCSGNCANNGDCGEGCYCKNGKCTPNPCYGKSCQNGLDCGEGCGCKDGQCVPCDSLGCDTCDNVLGCTCTNGKCGKVGGCSGNCGDSSDCGEGCTCHEGKCVNCKEFNCTECNSKKGCACLNGKCQDDPNEQSCSDTFKLIKDNANCDLTAELVKEEECSCSKITVASKLANVVKTGGDYLFDFKVELRKGSVATANAVNTLSLLADLTKGDIAENETPTSGVVELAITPFFKEYDAQGRLVGITAGTKEVSTGSYSNTDTHLFSGLNILKAGTQISDLVFVDRVEVEITHKTKFVHPNGCEYKGSEIAKYTFGASTNFDGLAVGTVSKEIYTKFITLSSDKSRMPLITWYRSKDNNFTDNEIIRKLYVPKISGKYSDTLRGMDKIAPKGKYPTVNKEGLLWYGYSYMVSTDCGCVKNAEHLNLVFCNPNDLFYELSECNKRIDLFPPFVPCDMNQDINIWKANDNFIPDDAQAKYDLYLNGVKKVTFKHDKSLGMVKDGTGDSMFDTYLNDTPITKIELKHNHDISGECTITYNEDLPTRYDMVYDKNCAISGSTYQMAFEKVTDDYVLVNISGENISVIEYGGYFAVTLIKGASTTITFTFANGCTQEEVYNEDCCSDFSATLLASGGTCGDPLVLNTGLVGGNPNYTYVYTKPNGQTVTGTNVLTLTSYTGGTYRVTVTDANGCISTAQTDITVSGAPTLTFSGYSNICEGQETMLVITGNAITIGQTINYKLNGVSQSFIMPSNGVFEIEEIDVDSVFTDFQVTIDGCTTTFPDTISISTISAPQATISGEATICAGTTTQLSVIGTAGAVVTINNGVGVKTIPNCGSPICSLLVPVTPLADVTYSITSVTLGSCTGSGDGSAELTVNNGSPITKLSESCASLTSKTIIFNHIDTAEDQLGNNISISGGTTITVNPQAVTQVTVTYDNGQCEVTQTFNIAPCPCPDITGTLAINMSGTHCANPLAVSTPVSLTGSPSNGTAPYTYLWDNGNTGTSSTYSIANAGVYTKSVTVTDANGCSGVVSLTYTVYPQVEAKIYVGATEITGDTYDTGNDNSVLLTGIGIASGGTFSWDDGVNTGTGTTFLVDNMSPDETRTVTLTYTKNGCVDSVTADIYFPAP